MRVWFGRHIRTDDHLLMQVDEQKRSSRIEWLDLVSRKTTLFRATASKHDLAECGSARGVSVTSKDGTKIPLSLIHRPGIPLDGSNADAALCLWRLLRSRNGWPTARPSLPGCGLAACSRWHRSAAAANSERLGTTAAGSATSRTASTISSRRREWLIDNRYARPERLGINGASNGGLLVLVDHVATPRAVRAVVSGVPVADMLRFKQFTFGSNWTFEYGDPANEADFKTLFAYSPLHNVRRGVKYPPLLILTADNDDRVVPAHAYKIAAAIQSEAPESEIYVKVEKRPATASAMRCRSRSTAPPTRWRSCGTGSAGRSRSSRRSSNSRETFAAVRRCLP